MAEWEMQIFAINLIVGDLARSKRFYREVLGLVRPGVGCADAASPRTVQP
jgi:catechol-2,3-dioxygenase